MNQKRSVSRRLSKNGIFVLLIGNTLLISSAAQATIHGTDDRHEPWEVTNPIIRRVFDSTATLMFDKNLKLAADGIYDVVGKRMGDAMNSCRGERFVEETSAGFCSGVLVAPDVLLTAGHCLVGDDPVQACKSMRVTFDFFMTSATQTQFRLKKEQVYTCAGVVGTHSMPISGKQGEIVEDRPDYLLVKLDRKVEGREPVKVRIGNPEDLAGKAIFSVSSPIGLPKKISDNARVITDAEALKAEDQIIRDSLSKSKPELNREMLHTDLDITGGSSGGPVFLAETGELIAINHAVQNDDATGWDSHYLLPYFQRGKFSLPCHQERRYDPLKAVTDAATIVPRVRDLNKRADVLEERVKSDAKAYETAQKAGDVATSESLKADAKVAARDLEPIQVELGKIYGTQLNFLAASEVFHIGDTADVKGLVQGPAPATFDLASYIAGYDDILGGYKSAAGKLRPFTDVQERLKARAVEKVACVALDPRGPISRHSFSQSVKSIITPSSGGAISADGKSLERSVKGDKGTVKMRAFGADDRGFFLETVVYLDPPQPRKGLFGRKLPPAPLPVVPDALKSVVDSAPLLMLNFCAYDAATLDKMPRFPSAKSTVVADSSAAPAELKTPDEKAVKAVRYEFY